MPNSHHQTLLITSKYASSVRLCLWILTINMWYLGDDQTLYNHFRRGLRSDVKNLLLNFLKPTSLSQAITQAIRYDNWLFEFRQEEQATSRWTTPITELIANFIYRLPSYLLCSSIAPSTLLCPNSVYSSVSISTLSTLLSLSMTVYWSSCWRFGRLNKSLFQGSHWDKSKVLEALVRTTHKLGQRGIDTFLQVDWTVIGSMFRQVIYILFIKHVLKVFILRQ
jgi:hypothetical protein